MLRRMLAWKLSGRGKPENAMQQLLDHCSSERDSPSYFWTLIHAVERLKDDQFMQGVLDEWQKYGTSYAERVRQGNYHITWAWEARGNGLANTVSTTNWKRFYDRLTVARACYEDAARLNPFDWVAHTQLITVAKGLGLPETYVRKHRQAAITAYDRVWQPWNTSLEYLQQKWHGDPDRLIRFARECVDSEQWELGIPLLAGHALQEAATEPFVMVVDYDVYRRPDVWNIFSDLYERSLEQDNQSVRYDARNWYVFLGSVTGHWEEIASEFEQLKFPELSDAEYERTVMSVLRHARTHVELLSRQVDSNTARLAEAQLLLLHDQPQSCEAILDKLDVNFAEKNELIAYMRRLLAFQRRLETDKRIELSPADFLDTFCEVTRDGLVPLRNAAGWSTDQNSVSFVIDEDYKPGESWIRTIVIPIGMAQSQLSGEIFGYDRIEKVSLIPHAFAERDQPVGIFDVKTRTIYVERNRKTIADTTSSYGHHRMDSLNTSFVVGKGQTEDRFELDGKHVWETRTINYIPSSFGFQIESTARKAQCSFRNITIESP